MGVRGQLFYGVTEILRHHTDWAMTGPDDSGDWHLVCFDCSAPLGVVGVIAYEFDAETEDDRRLAFEHVHTEHVADMIMAIVTPREDA